MFKYEIIDTRQNLNIFSIQYPNWFSKLNEAKLYRWSDAIKHFSLFLKCIAFEQKVTLIFNFIENEAETEQHITLFCDSL